MKYKIRLEHSPRHHGWFWYVDGCLEGFAQTKWGARRLAERKIRRNEKSAQKEINYTYDTDKGYGSVSM